MSIFLIATSIAGITSVAVAATGSNTDFFSVTPEKLAAHTNVELNQIFTTGVGPYSSSMIGKIYPYMLPQNAVGTVPYNGCYDEKNNRLGGLDVDNSCAAWIKTRPGISIFRLFIGYKVDCAELSATGGCLDMALHMNCQYTQVQVGTGPMDGVVAPRLCSKGSPIIRKAKANSNNNPAFDGCYPGQDGTTYPVCTSCENGKYNGTIGANMSACTPCTASSISGATNAATPPTQFITVPANGAYASSQCQIALSDSWTCAVGYTKTTDNQACVPTPSCSLALNVTPTSPSAVGAADGKIIATYTGESGTVSTFGIISPAYMAPKPLSGSTGTFDGLTQNTYKVSVTDSACTTSTNITLSDSSLPSCSSCPSGSTPSGNQCMVSPTTSSGFSNWIYACQGYGGCTTIPCPNVTCTVGQSFGQVSMSDTTPRTCDGAYVWTGFGGDCYKNNTISPNPTAPTASVSCPSGFALTAGTCTMTCAPATSSCALTLTATGTDPTTSTATDGKIAASTSGAIGTVSFTSSGGSVSTSGTNATVTGLGSGTYIVTATDGGSSGCSSSKSVTLAASTGPTPSPAPCDPVTTIAAATTAVSCQYSCSSDTYGIGVRSGYIAVGESCSSASAKTRRANGTGCTGPTATSCGQGTVSTYAGVYQTCKDYTCPATTTKYLLWDAGGLIAYRTIMGNMYGGPCYNPSGSDTYYGCGGFPPPSGPDYFILCANGYFGHKGKCTQ